jgi:type VI secretion system protein ImpB
MARIGGRRDLEHLRASRVHLTYDVEVGGETQRKELPFVIGVLADFSGKPDGPVRKLRDREFVEISRDTFDTVLRAMRPRLAFNVANKLADEESKLGIELRFESFEDFEPQQVAMQVRPLRRLIAMRERLAAVRAAVRRSADSPARRTMANATSEGGAADRGDDRR